MRHRVPGLIPFITLLLALPASRLPQPAPATVGFIPILDDDLPRGALLGWSALGGVLVALGLFQIGKGLWHRSIGVLVWGAIFLGGAHAVLHIQGFR